MELEFYSVYDKKAKAYNRPFVLQNKDVALRAIKDAIGKDENFKNHPEDYDLYQLGHYNDGNGEITGLAEPQLVIRLKDLTK